MKYQETAVVLSQQIIGEGICDLHLEAPKIASAAAPGQFVSVYCRDKSRLLPRPISICRADADTGTVRLVYRIAGAGTKEFSLYGAGEKVDLVGPLGNGFPLGEDQKGIRSLLIGGGIGIPPMLYLAGALMDKDRAADVQAVLGYRDERFLEEDFREVLGSVYLATEDGSAGTKGTVLDAIRENALCADVIFACGPMPMLRAVKNYAEEQGVECYLSLEERMACGVGACLGCVCETEQTDEHTKVRNKRICVEGPVFRAEEIIL